MNMMLKATTLAVAIGLLSACTSTFDPNFGSSVDYNTRLQTLNDDAGYQSSTATLEGQKAEKLLGEYRGEKADAPDERLVESIGN